MIHIICGKLSLMKVFILFASLIQFLIYLAHLQVLIFIFLTLPIILFYYNLVIIYCKIMAILLSKAV